MASFDENIVREYFELHGFLVRQVRKYRVQSRRKLAEEEIDLIVQNPHYQRNGRKPEFFLFSSELPHIHRAIVAVKGWHSLRVTPAKLKSGSALLKFLESNVQKEAQKLFEYDEGELANPDAFLKILVLPGLPLHEPHRSESVRMLRDRGVDGIVSFRSMLLDILAKIEPNLNYQKSDLLQVLRILKIYDLVKDPQMELFPSGKR